MALYTNFDGLIGEVKLVLISAKKFNLESVPVTNAVVFEEAAVALIDNLVMQGTKKGYAFIIGFTATTFRKQDNFENKYLA